jgi:hypothetical protein
MFILDSQKREKTFNAILNITNSHEIIIDLSNIDFAMNSHVLNQISVIKPFDKGCPFFYMSNFPKTNLNFCKIHKQEARCAKV